MDPRLQTLWMKYLRWASPARSRSFASLRMTSGGSRSFALLR